jgi:3-oxoacyl-[acyl-carrier protein] reductase
MGRLDGKVAVVTGGARGIGRGISRRFAREGGSVLVADIAADEGKTVASDLSGLGGEGIFLETDVTKKADVERMVTAAQQAWGHVDIVVNNALTLTPHVSLERKTDEMMEISLKVGPYATLWAMQAAFPIMRAQGGGRFISLYSADADYGEWYHGDYNAAKAAIRSITVSGAAEWGRYNILCNAIAPVAAGSVYEAVKHLPGVQEFEANLPLKRVGDPENDIAPVALFLASEDSQYVNGQTIYVDGGVRLSAGRLYEEEDPDFVDAWLARYRAK